MSLGLYLHIPFCQSKCNYCHFLSMPLNRELADKYKRCMEKEIESYVGFDFANSVDSVYFGGGTPSLLAGNEIADLLAACRRRFPFSETCEISLEANPGSVSPDKLAQLREAGVNRISFGAQSFSDKELKAIGRLHTAEDIFESLDQARAAGFTNINFDLILGLPFQTDESWRKNLETAARLRANHISVYMLDLDEDCPLQSMVENGVVSLPDEELIADLYLETVRFFSENGYAQYEISNFALPGGICRHNLKYWKRDLYYGFGLGSHSFDGRERHSNHSQIDAYISSIENGMSPIGWREPVDIDQALSEALFLGLRLTEGVNWKELEAAFESRRLAEYKNDLIELSQKGFVEWIGEMARLTPSGMLVSNEIFQKFV